MSSHTPPLLLLAQEQRSHFPDEARKSKKTDQCTHEAQGWSRYLLLALLVQRRRSPAALARSGSLRSPERASAAGEPTPKPNAQERNHLQLDAWKRTYKGCPALREATLGDTPKAGDNPEWVVASPCCVPKGKEVATTFSGLNPPRHRTLPYPRGTSDSLFLTQRLAWAGVLSSSCNCFSRISARSAPRAGPGFMPSAMRSFPVIRGWPACGLGARTTARPPRNSSSAGGPLPPPATRPCSNDPQHRRQGVTHRRRMRCGSRRTTF